MSFESKEIERAVLASLLNDPGYIAEIGSIIKPSFFKPRYNQLIYEVMVSLFNEVGTLDRSIMTARLFSIGLKKVEDFDTIEYISILEKTHFDQKNRIDYVRELVKFHKLREAFAESKNLQKSIQDCTAKKLSETMPILEEHCSKITSIDIGDDEAQIVDLYGTLQENMEEIAMSPKRSIIKTGMSLFDGFWGGLYYGGLSIVCAFYKVGKSAILQELSRQCCLNEMNNDMVVLYLDTEMNHIENQSRIAATYSGNNVDDFEEGTFMSDEVKKKKAQKAWDRAEKLKGKVYHIQCGDMDIKKLESTIKRFYSKTVKGRDFLVVYDYLKLTGETLSDFNKEYQVLGDKCNALKKLAEKLPRTSVLTAVQLNESGAVASSSRMKWFASLLVDFQRLSDEDRFRFKSAGIEATHILKTNEARKLGPLGRNEMAFEVIREGAKKKEYVKNGILINMDNFELTERGTYKEAYERSESPDLEVKKKKGKGEPWEDYIGENDF